MKTLIHFHEIGVESSGSSLRQVKHHRTLEWDGEVTQEDAIEMIKYAGFKPLDNRVMLEVL